MLHKVEYHIEFAEGTDEKRVLMVAQLLSAYLMENNLRPFELNVQHEVGRGTSASRIELGFDESSDGGHELTKLAPPAQRVGDIHTLLSHYSDIEVRAYRTLQAG